jgi:thymidylate kinase
MKLIIEGPNNVGKSTIINELKKLQWFENYNVVHFGANTPKMYDFYKDVLNDYDDIICDRYMISELVYSEYYKRTSLVDIESCIKLINDHVCRNEDIVIIFVDAQYEFIVNSYKQKQEEFDYKLVRFERIKFNHYKELISQKCPEVKVISVYNSVDNNYQIAHIINKILLQKGGK